MRRLFLRPAASAWRLRPKTQVRRSHEVLEKQLNLKQPHELPNQGRVHRLTNKKTPWPIVLAFGALSIAGIGAAAYGIHRYYTLRPSAKRILDIHAFLPFTLTSKERISTTCTIFTVAPTSHQMSAGDPYERLWRSPVWSVQAKQPQLQIARSYTPLPPSPSPDQSDAEARTLRFVIKEEDRGEMSGYLHRLGVGSTLELRGPQLECQIPPGADEVIFFAGGTGIAPALQIAHHLSSSTPVAGKMPRMRIVWSNRKREDCEGGVNDTFDAQTGSSLWAKLLGGGPNGAQVTAGAPQGRLVAELELLKAKFKGRLQVDYFVDEENTIISHAVVRRYLTPSTPEEELSRKAIFVSGPDGYVNYVAGPKEWQKGKAIQGPLGGLLKNAVLPHWPVLKL